MPNISHHNTLKITVIGDDDGPQGLLLEGQCDTCGPFLVSLPIHHVVGVITALTEVLEHLKDELPTLLTESRQVHFVGAGLSDDPPPWALRSLPHDDDEKKH